jgi:hypothetical protein
LLPIFGLNGRYRSNNGVKQSYSTAKLSAAWIKRVSNYIIASALFSTKVVSASNFEILRVGRGYSVGK